jgi:hypothetical protein
MASSGDSEPASNIPNPGLIPVAILSPVESPTFDPVVGVSSAAVSTFDSIIGVGLRYYSKCRRKA